MRILDLLTAALDRHGASAIRPNVISANGGDVVLSCNDFLDERGNPLAAPLARDVFNECSGILTTDAHASDMSLTAYIDHVNSLIRANPSRALDSLGVADLELFISEFRARAGNVADIDSVLASMNVSNDVREIMRR